MYYAADGSRQESESRNGESEALAADKSEILFKYVAVIERLSRSLSVSEGQKYACRREKSRHDKRCDHSDRQTDYALQKVMFSAYSKVQDDMAKVREMMRKTLRISTFVLSPLMFGMLACSENFVLTLLGEKWAGSIPYMQVFCISFFLQPLSTTAAQALNGIGRSDLTLKLGVGTKLFGIAVIFVASLLGVPYIAGAVLLTTMLSATVFMIFNKKIFGYCVKDQLLDIAGNVLNAVAMCAVCLGVGYLCRPLPTLVGLVLQILVGAVWYVLIAFLFKNENLAYLTRKAKSFLKK